MNLPRLFKRLALPAVVQVDFSDPCWNDTPRALAGWIGLAVTADLIAQWASGVAGWWSVVMAGLTALMLATLPARLAGALSGLYVTQAIISYVLFRAALEGGLSETITEVVLWAWQGWCFVAFALLALRYLRTPRAAFR